MTAEDVYSKLILKNVEFTIPQWGEGDLEIKYPNGIKLRYHTKWISSDIIDVITSCDLVQLIVLYLNQ